MTTTAAPPTYYTPSQVADLFQVPREFVLDSVRERGWPHLRLSARTVRFTAADVEAIARLCHREMAQAREEPNPWGRRTRGKRST